MRQKQNGNENVLWQYCWLRMAILMDLDGDIRQVNYNRWGAYFALGLGPSPKKWPSWSVHFSIKLPFRTKPKQERVSQKHIGLLDSPKYLNGKIREAQFMATFDNLSPALIRVSCTSGLPAGWQSSFNRTRSLCWRRSSGLLNKMPVEYLRNLRYFQPMTTCWLMCIQNRSHCRLNNVDSKQLV